MLSYDILPSSCRLLARRDPSSDNKSGRVFPSISTSFSSPYAIAHAAHSSLDMIRRSISNKAGRVHRRMRPAIPDVIPTGKIITSLPLFLACFLPPPLRLALSPLHTPPHITRTKKIAHKLSHTKNGRWEAVGNNFPLKVGSGI